jgi:hypothetical protein
VIRLPIEIAGRLLDLLCNELERTLFWSSAPGLNEISRPAPVIETTGYLPLPLRFGAKKSPSPWTGAFSFLQTSLPEDYL